MQERCSNRSNKVLSVGYQEENKSYMTIWKYIMDISPDIYLQQPFFFPKYRGNFQESVLRSDKIQYVERLCSKYGSCSLLEKTHLEHPELLKLPLLAVIISFHFISFHFVSFSFLSFHFLSFSFLSFHVHSLSLFSFQLLSFHFISFHFISFQFLSFPDAPSVGPTTKLMF